MRYFQLKVNLLVVAMFLLVNTIKFENKDEEEQDYTFGNIKAQSTIDEFLAGKHDIFMWDNVVYSTDIEWINALILTECELLGLITYKSVDANTFSNGTANRLNLGSEVYSVNERGDVLIVKDGSSYKYYLKMVEV